MSEFRADLHTHTTCSDGSDTPEELLLRAKEIGLQGLSITDHDTTLAYTPKLFELATQLELKLLVGIEFSAYLGQESVHVLGYGFDLSSLAIQALCKRQTERRHNRNRAILRLLRSHDISIDESELPQEGSVGRPHIAALLVQKGHVKDIKEAFDRYIGDKRPCYALAEMISVDETVQIIHRAKGKAFIAHPHLAKRRVLKQLLKMPFDGIECYYARFPADQERAYLQMAERHKLLVSGGSDYHGSIKAQNPLGSSWVNRETFAAIANEKM